MAISGDFVVIGEQWADVESHEKAGRAHIYDTNWNHLATLQAPTPEADARFGNAVAISGNMVVVGESQRDGETINDGSAYIFDSDGNLLAILQSPEPYPGAMFGYSVDVSEDIVAVGERYTTVEGESKAGKVHIFQAGAAAFTSSGLNIDPSSVDVGGKVTISVEVSNTGAKSGTHIVALKIDGEVEDEKTVTVNPDETETVSFEVSASELGTFSVEVDGLSGSYTVTEPEEPSFWERIPGFQYESIGRKEYGKMEDLYFLCDDIWVSFSRLIIQVLEAFIVCQVLCCFTIIQNYLLHSFPETHDIPCRKDLVKQVWVYHPIF